MTRMLLKLMLPISIVEKQAWRELLSVVDPSFSVPSVQTVKSRFDPMIAKVEKLIEKQLADIEYVNASVDGWSDRTNRSFNGYVGQGINSNWELLTIPIAFEHIVGKHTGIFIKEPFVLVTTKFNIKNKIFKIVADQVTSFYYIISFYFNLFL
jgi:hypothetical protein